MILSKANNIFLKKHKNNLSTPLNVNQFKYSLKFITIITPGTLHKISLLTSKANLNTGHKKLLIKQSYILLVWLTYLQGNYSKFDENQNTPSFFVHKKQQFKTTKLKTPMAHKTFSQEQFLFKYYTLSISFKSTNKKLNYPKSVNKSVFAILNFRKSLPFFATNLLFLKSFKLMFYSSDSNYMRIY